MLEYALRQERNRYLTNAQQNAAAAAAAVAAQREKEAAAAANATANKDKKPTEGAENEDKRDKIASAIPENKKKALTTGTASAAGAAGTASGRASPAPPSEDGQSSAGSSGGTFHASEVFFGQQAYIRCTSVPEVIVSSSAQPNTTASAVPAHLQQGQSNLHRAGSTASLVSLPNGASTMNLPAGSSTLNLGGGTLNLSGFNPGVGRDPRARAKSREYLKQCLQEITYLTSAAALNPLPERTPGGVSRPRKEMRDIPREKEKEELPPLVPPPVVVVQQDKEGNKIVPLDPAAAATAEKSTNAEALNTTLSTSEASQSKSEVAAKGDVGGNPSLNGPLARKAEATTAVTSYSSSSTTSSAPKAVADLFSNLQGADVAASAAPTGDSANQVTAIFRPESSEEWQKALKKAGQSIQGPQAGSSTDSAGSTVSLKELQEKNGKGSSAVDAPIAGGKNGGASAAAANTMRGRSDTAVLANSSGSSSISSSQKEVQDSNEHKNWKPRRTLRAYVVPVCQTKR